MSVSRLRTRDTQMNKTLCPQETRAEWKRDRYLFPVTVITSYYNLGGLKINLKFSFKYRLVLLKF